MAPAPVRRPGLGLANRETSPRSITQTPTRFILTPQTYRSKINLDLLKFINKIYFREPVKDFVMTATIEP